MSQDQNKQKEFDEVIKKLLKAPPQPKNKSNTPKKKKPADRRAEGKI